METSVDIQTDLPAHGRIWTHLEKSQRDPETSGSIEKYLEACDASDDSCKRLKTSERIWRHPNASGGLST